VRREAAAIARSGRSGAPATRAQSLHGSVSAMQLDEVAGADDAFLYMERYVDEGAKSYSRFAATTEAAPQYQPRSHAPSFEAITVLVPHERARVFEAAPTEALRRHYVRPDGIVFAVHPETWATAGVEGMDELRALPQGEPIRVAPTASTRTVLVLDRPAGVPPHFLKLHYPRRISRFYRRLRRKGIENSVAVTADLAALHLDRFAYLPDAVGCVFGDSEESWGFLVREATPRPRRAGDDARDARMLLPCFALFAGDLEHPTHRPLIVQLIEHLGVRPEALLLEEILLPVVRCWARIVRERGLLLEWHAQNTLLEIDRGFRPRRIVHRDCDVWIDAAARKRAGLALPFHGAAQISLDDRDTVAPHYSLVYDHFIGRELFDYLVEAVARFHPIDVQAIRDEVRAAFHTAFPEATRLFPPESTFYFEDELRPNNEVTLVDTNERPRWR
jgi:hypothetical protein